ncbi:MAG TPA: altronate dehydratase family protein [Terriglobales bacterium]|jgi:altronate hydrolase|nr:altronate dehydratase family protein [Terriglobales bacterium]
MSVLKLLQRNVMRIGTDDNVAVALLRLEAGEEVVLAGQTYQIQSRVPAKHKFALQDFKAGDRIIMYGGLVGEATTAIRRGEAITVSNMRHQSSDFHPKSSSQTWDAPDVSRWKGRTFQGYRRADGQVGTRNYWVVIPLVFCENRNIRALQEAFEKELGISAQQPYRRHVAELVKLYREGKAAEINNYEFTGTPSAPASSTIFPNLDGIKFLTHEMGCGGTRQDAQALCGLMAGYIHHPNVAGATILSLGCQHAQVSMLREELHKRDPRFDKPLLIFDQQASNLESAMLGDAIRQTFLGLVEANRLTRVPAPLSALTVGLKCGGSDGFSGITANPAIGYLSDLVAALGGKSILSEFPELCGVEQNLIDRCKSGAAADKFISLMRTYAARAEAAGSGFDMNPSPGNIKDGLITDAMKSAGAARKGGTSPVSDVLDYPQYAVEPGLNLLCTPGSDVEAVTAQVAAGANIVLFTTGLGTPTGNPIAPVIKLATNSELAGRMHDIIDIDTGQVITGGVTIEQMGESILEQVISIASGENHTKAELKSQEDFIPWKRGVSL